MTILQRLGFGMRNVNQAIRLPFQHPSLFKYFIFLSCMGLLFILAVLPLSLVRVAPDLLSSWLPLSFTN